MGQQEGDESRLRTKIKEMRTLVDMLHYIPVPASYRATTQEVRTPFVRDAVDRVSAAMTRNSIVTHCEPIARTKESRDAANIAERFLDNTRVRLNKDLGEDAVYESTFALVRDGESVLKGVHKPDAWANFPQREKGERAGDYVERLEREKKKRSLPYAWRVVDRLSMLFSEGEFGDEWALEYGEYPKPYLMNRYRMAQDSRTEMLINPQNVLGGQPKPEGVLQTTNGRSLKLEYWNADWWAVVIDGQMAPGYPKPNPYAPRLPYFRAKTGSGSRESVLYAMRYLQPALDAMITMKMNWAYLSAYPTPVKRAAANAQATDVDLGADQEDAVVYQPGVQIDLPPGYELDFLSPPPVGQDIDEMIAILRGLLDIAGIPSVFRGIGGADQAGYAINQLINAATVTYGRLVEALTRQFEDAFEFFLWLVPNRIKEEVYVPDFGVGDERDRYLGLKPTGRLTETCAPVDQVGSVSVQFRPVLPTDEQVRAMVATQLVASGLNSKRRALEKHLQEEDPEGLIDEIWLEKTLESEAVNGRVVLEAMREAKMLPEPVTGANSGLAEPDGNPLVPQPFPPGQSAQGLPGLPGLTQPLQPSKPATPEIAVGRGGRPAGAAPGRPSGARRRAPQEGR